MKNMFNDLYHILGKSEQNQIKRLTVLSFLSPFFDLFSFSVIIYILNVAINQSHISQDLILFTLGMGIISLLKNFFELYKEYTQNHFVQFSAQHLSLKLFEMMQKEDLQKHNEKDPIQALVLIREDSTNCINILTGSITVLVNSITLIGFFIILIYVSQLLGILICISLLIGMIAMYKQYKIEMKISGEKRRHAIIKTNAQITTAFGNFKEIKIDQRSHKLLNKYNEISRKLADIQTDFSFKSCIIQVLLPNSILTILFFVLAIVMSIEIQLSSLLASFVVCITLMIRMLPMIVNTINGMINIEYAYKSFEAVQQSLAQFKHIKEEEKQSKRKKKVTLNRGIFIRHLWFGYNKNKNILEDVSIDIPAGKSIAIIGISGAGKTTFLDLVLGLLKPSSGSIFYDDYDIVSKTDNKGECSINLGDIVSYIPQTIFLNGETIANNVAFFEDEDKINENKVIECLKIAQIWEEVKELPDGIHTLIGENGTTISGGQRQRIALARALYKDFEILIMDEATAALDMETEKAVIDSIRQIKKNKTLLMVTHHMSLANECELLYKIENKKIIRIR